MFEVYRHLLMADKTTENDLIPVESLTIKHLGWNNLDSSSLKAHEFIQAS